MNRTFLRIQTKIHQTLYRWSNGKIGSYFGAPTLLLNTIGRKSGKAYINPLFYVQDKDCWVVVASNAGAEQAPSWWLNLQANPQTHIQVKDQIHLVNARLASSEERSQLWPKMLQIFAGYDAYQNQTKRKMAVVILQAINKENEQSR